MGIEDFSVDSNEHAERVLLIGNSEETLGALSCILAKRNYESVCTESIPQASQLAIKQLFDLIVLDQRETESSPVDLVQDIQADPCLRRSPLLLLHSDSTIGQSPFFTDPGINIQLLEAPFEPSSFLVKVATQLRLRKIKVDQASFEVELSTQNAQLRDLTNRFKHELREARTIQQSILPKELPSAGNTVFAAYCAPLEAVGGDLFDVWKIDSERFGLFIGDVTGHGLPAAFIGAMTKMALSYAPKEDPAQMLAHMNCGMANHIPDGRFVTAAAAIFNPAKGLLQVARAGHPPPYLWKAKTGEVELLEPKGLPLGIIEGSQYLLQETTMEPGDKLLMLTDGLTEAADMNGKMLGTEGVAELFANVAKDQPIDQCIQLVLKQQKEFCGGRLMKDDNTLVGLELLI